MGLLLLGGGAAGANGLHIKHACLQRQRFNSILSSPHLDTSTSVFHHAAGASGEEHGKDENKRKQRRGCSPSGTAHSRTAMIQRAPPAGRERVLFPLHPRRKTIMPCSSCYISISSKTTSFQIESNFSPHMKLCCERLFDFNPCFFPFRSRFMAELLRRTTLRTIDALEEQKVIFIYSAGFPPS